MENQHMCTVCDEILHADDNIATVHEKGLLTFINKSSENGDEKWKLWINKKEITMHEACRKRYSAKSLKSNSTIRKRHSAPPILTFLNNMSESTVSQSSSEQQSDCIRTPTIPPKSLPLIPIMPVSSPIPSTSACTIRTDNIDRLNFRLYCIFCRKLLDQKHKLVRKLMHEQTLDKIVLRALERNDEQGNQVNSLLKHISLTEQNNIFYHSKCYTSFFYKSSEVADNVDNDLEKLEEVCNVIEESGEFQFRVQELQDVTTGGVTNKKLFDKLNDKYGDDIYIQQHRGRQPMIHYKVPEVFKRWFTNKETISEHEKKIILTVAAQILRSEISENKYEREIYPPANKFLENITSDVNPSLLLFLKEMLLTDSNEDKKENYTKLISIAHSIISLIRPRSFISNLHLAVGTYVYRKTGSKLIIKILSKLGVCASYHNIQLYEASIVMDPPKMNTGTSFVQHVFDNTDHNVATLTGHETFHCLGGIAIYNPEYEIEYEGGSKKLKKMPSAAELASQQKIIIRPFVPSNSGGLQNVIYMPLNLLDTKKLSLICPSYGAYIWAKAYDVPKLPTWRGFFEVISREITFSTSHVSCLPFINAPPSDLTTLYTALKYAATQCQSLKQRACFVTYDQPLYWKARCIVEQEKYNGLGNVFVRLGGFHLLMSYLGSIGFIMDGSGLEDLWSTAYAPESVKKMLSGNAFSRAMRAHILTFTSIAIIICRLKDVPEDFRNYVHFKFGKWKSEPPMMGDFHVDLAFQDLTKEFIERIEALEKRSKTAKLWIQYFKCVTLALKFIEAERLGNWDMHLAVIKEMLPIFHAAGHFAYAKSAQIYLQDMVNLEAMMDPDEFSKFATDGFFTVHRTDKAWCGTWTDMVIEQTLNRFFGTDLKHGRGVTANVVARYLLAMPSAFSVMECLENFCNVTSTTTEQHVDITKSRIKMDEEHILKFLFWFNEHNPFKDGLNLISLSNGVVGGEDINCHMAFEKGLESLSQMEGKSAKEITMSTTYRVKSLTCANTAAHTDNTSMFKIDATLLFQRISVIFASNSEQSRDAFAYELSPFPTSLFCENGFMRKNTKSDLYKIFEVHLCSQSLIQSFTCVVDGGWLLHKVVWPHGKRYCDIFEIYRTRLISNFGSNVTVVFDGYNNEVIGTKSYERYRRKEKNYAADVEIDRDKLTSSSQKQFLSNVTNKYKFVQLLVEYLKDFNIKTKIATEDADTLIVNTAIALKDQIDGPVAIVGNDIDLFVIAIALTPDDTNIFFHKKGTGKIPDRLYSTSNNEEYRPFILFAHAFGGCDTTSAIFNKGKLSIIRMIQTDEDLQNSVSIFRESGKSEHDLYKSAEKIMMKLYTTRCIDAESINELRYKLYPSLVILTKKKFSLASLPPTDAALLEHVKRVYYQVQQWLGNKLNPESWGWKRTNFMLIPIMTKKAIAPEELLKMIFCGCQKNCSTTRCTCKKAGLNCTKACRYCNGESCDNSSNDKITFEDEINDEFEIDEEENSSSSDDEYD